MNEITQQFLMETFDYRGGELYWKKTTALCKHPGMKAGHLFKGNGYCRVQINKKPYLIHRLVFLMHKGYLPRNIDHIDGNRSNNKIENLREATHAQNSMNRKMPTTNKSGYKNVCWDKRFKKWSVNLHVNKKNIVIGQFDDLELAGLVAAEARDKYHGAFAR